MIIETTRFGDSSQGLMDMKWKIVNDKRAGASWEIGYN